MKKGDKCAKWVSKFDINKILKLEEEGKNIKQIAEILEIPNRRLSDLLKLNNITIKSSQHTIAKNNDFFENIDSEIKAYLLGYTLADGCILIEPKRKKGVVYSYSKRLSFCVSIDDKEVINYLRDNISPTSKIKEFHNSKGAINRKNQLSLRFSSSKIVDDLIKLNILPNKTYHSDFKFDFNKLDVKFHRDFIRGFFDGDGHYTKGGLQFVSTSKYFLEQIVEFFTYNIPSITFRYYKYKGITIDYYKLCFNTGKGIEKQVYNLLYKDSNYYLQRKKIKFNIENTVLN